MAKITINIPVDKEDWVLNGLAIRFGYTALINNPDFKPENVVDAETNPMTIDNPETKPQFAKRMIINMIKDAANQGYNQMSNKSNADIANAVELD